MAGGLSGLCNSAGMPPSAGCAVKTTQNDIYGISQARHLLRSPICMNIRPQRPLSGVHPRPGALQGHRALLAGQFDPGIVVDDDEPLPVLDAPADPLPAPAGRPRRAMHCSASSHRRYSPGIAGQLPGNSLAL